MKYGHVLSGARLSSTLPFLDGYLILKLGAGVEGRVHGLVFKSDDVTALIFSRVYISNFYYWIGSVNIQVFEASHKLSQHEFVDGAWFCDLFHFDFAYLNDTN